jgi:hypothetical protein
VRHHFQMLCESPVSATYLPLGNIKERLEQANRHFPDHSDCLLGTLSGSTYVPVRDAVVMQESAYDEQPVSLTVSETEEIDIFEPPWPPNMIRVHPYDFYREKFTSVQAPISQSDEEGFHLWSLMCIILCVDEIWNIASRSMKTDNDMFGYLMALAWQQRRQDTGRSGSSRSHKFFNLKKTGNTTNEDASNDDDSDDEYAHNSSNGVCHQLLVRLGATDNAEALVWPQVPADSRITSFQHRWDPLSVGDASDYAIVSFSDYQSVIYRERNDGSHHLLYEGSEDPDIGHGWESVLIVTKPETPRTWKKKKWTGCV